MNLSVFERMLKLWLRFRMDDRMRPKIHSLLINDCAENILPGSDFLEIKIALENVIFLNVGMQNIPVRPNLCHLKIQLPIDVVKSNENITLIGAYEDLKLRLVVIETEDELFHCDPCQEKQSHRSLVKYVIHTEPLTEVKQAINSKKIIYTYG
jgi:hypothetical protein